MVRQVDSWPFVQRQPLQWRWRGFGTVDDFLEFFVETYEFFWVCPHLSIELYPCFFELLDGHLEELVYLFLRQVKKLVTGHLLNLILTVLNGILPLGASSCGWGRYRDHQERDETSSTAPRECHIFSLHRTRSNPS
jgi:hypothetical protein